MLKVLLRIAMMRVEIPSIVTEKQDDEELCDDR